MPKNANITVKCYGYSWIYFRGVYKFGQKISPFQQCIISYAFILQNIINIFIFHNNVLFFLMIRNSLTTSRNKNCNIDSTNYNINILSFSNYSEDNSGYYTLRFVSGSTWV